MSHETEQKNLLTRIVSALLPNSDRYRAGAASFGVMPAVLLHGAGVAGWDELVIFGGIGVIILGLIFLSWRAGRKRKRMAGTRRRRQ